MEIGDCFQRHAWPIKKSSALDVGKTDQVETKCEGARLTIPSDGTDVWEIEPKYLKYGNKVASGSFAEL